MPTTTTTETSPKMNPKIKARWIKALLSGGYKQGDQGLKVTNKGRASYCCLGVLCDLHAKSTKGRWDGGLYFRHGGYPPEVVVRWAGLPSDDPRLNGRTLSWRNDGIDGSRQSFKQIAQAIQRHL